MKATRRKLATAGADGAGQLDLFMGELLTTSANKDDIGSMEHPVFSIKKGGDRVIRRYEYRDKYVEITPSAKG
ncbi:replication initiator protein A, partial [Acinetobacter baumannii]